MTLNNGIACSGVGPAVGRRYPNGSETTQSEPPRLVHAGDGALMVVLGDSISDASHARVAQLDRLVRAASIGGVLETVPAYTTLLVLYDPVSIGYEMMAAALHPLAHAAMDVARKAPNIGRTWRIPVCYGDNHGEDLAALAAYVGLSPDDVIAAHSAPTYTVYMLGFLPGFAYLGGLPEKLAMPRRATPRRCVQAGSVAIGSAQTAIWSIDGPSGWHLIGRTPCRTFDRSGTPGSFLSIGDRIVFEPVTQETYATLEAAAASGQRVAQEVI